MKKLFIMAILATAVFACSRKTVATASVPTNDAHMALAEQGKTVYTAKCGKCHGLKNTANYTAASWETILQKMAPKAKLTEEETTQVHAYVMANAKM